MTMSRFDMRRQSASRGLSTARKERKTHQLVRDHAVLPAIIRGRVRGLSWRRIAVQLTEDGFEAPRGGAVWSGNAVMRIGRRHKVDERVAAESERAVFEAPRAAAAEASRGAIIPDAPSVNEDLRVWIDTGGASAALLTVDDRWWCRVSAHPDEPFAWAHDMTFPSRLAGAAMGVLVRDCPVEQRRFQQDGLEVAALADRGCGRIRLRAVHDGPLARFDGIGARDWEVATRIVFNSWLSPTGPVASA